MFLIQHRNWPQRGNPGALLCWRSSDVSWEKGSDLGCGVTPGGTHGQLHLVQPGKRIGSFDKEYYIHLVIRLGIIRLSTSGLERAQADLCFCNCDNFCKYFQTLLEVSGFKWCCCSRAQGDGSQGRLRWTEPGDTQRPHPWSGSGGICPGCERACTGAFPAPGMCGCLSASPKPLHLSWGCRETKAKLPPDCGCCSGGLCLKNECGMHKKLVCLACSALG